ncbi:MYXO-CTERM sorting domain-containing protein [Pyxidicoccus xibeiensis]|uniref:MYXO-CTERM sorting domain-containing protein n=1 Tax=Pyxidicoccus xibeiensis TaxID=2906759 RepID=UPI0020A7B2D4|nr:MYXO-CTERM sorting domain-containing protein [Pyxidicoccus xibeiensis]MCP3137484.1 hypothetical protein [Pyxidicoccus xibeiensis]
MRAAIVFSLCLGMATTASAGWEQLDASERVQYVEAWPNGAFTAVATPYMDVFTPGRVESFPEGYVVGTFVSGACYAAVKPDSTTYSANTCWQPGSILPFHPTANSRVVERVQFTPSGTGYAVVRVDLNDLQLLTVPPVRVGRLAWDAIPVSNGAYTPGSPMSVTDTQGAVPHALFRLNLGPAAFLWFRGDRQQAEVTVQGGINFGERVVLDLFSGGTDPVALLARDTRLFRGVLRPPTPPETGPILPFSQVSLPDAGSPVSIVAVDMNTGGGSQYGEGYGLAVGTDGNGQIVVFQAVPADSAANAGTQWRVHPTLNSQSLEGSNEVPVAVACSESSLCVIGLDRPTGVGGNLIANRNAVGPVLNVGTTLVVNEGGSGQFQLSATDGDSDPVRVSMDATVAQGLLDGVASVPGPDRLDVTLTAPPIVCKDELTQLSVFASDGLASHDATATVSIRVANVRGPAKPGVTPASASTAASGEPREFVASPGGGECETEGYQWTSVGPDQPALVTDAMGRATFTPPPFLCSPTGRTYTYAVQGRDEGGAWSDTTPFTVDVAPWGRPSVPFAASAVRNLESSLGASVVVAPDALHPCAATPELPPVETEWRLSDLATGVPEGFTVLDADGNPVSLASPVVSPQLRVEAASCARGSLSLTARNRLETTAAGVQESADAVVRVDAAPRVEDFATASLDLTVASSPAGTVELGVGTSLRCPDERLRARMTLEEGGVQVVSEEVAVPGTWRPALPEACSTGGYRVQGQLFDYSTGSAVAGDTESLVVQDTRPVELGPLEGTALVARCGEGATATLTQTIPANACRASALAWTYESGPELTEGPLSGQSVTVATRETALEDLVGAFITLRVTADAGDGRTATTRHEVPITAEPFVELRYETESPSTSETGLVGVVARLRNTSACGVRTLRHVERVEGLEVVPGSVKLDGQPVTEQAVEGGFVVEGVTLEPNATRALTYVARPRLLASPRFGGEVTLNRVLVSGVTPVAPGTSGCGCSGGGSEAALFGLLALARVLRRRRD